MGKKDSPKVSRRSILKTGIGSMVGASALAGLAKSEETVKLPKFRAGGNIIEYFEVPQEWDDHRRIAKQVLSSNSEILSIDALG